MSTARIWVVSHLASAAGTKSAPALTPMDPDASGNRHADTMHTGRRGDGDRQMAEPARLRRAFVLRELREGDDRLFELNLLEDPGDDLLLQHQAFD